MTRDLHRVDEELMTEESEAPERFDLGKRIADNVVVMLLYAATGWLGLQLAVPPGYATLIWPASGIAAAALLIFGWHLWPGVFLGALTINLFNGFTTAPDNQLAAVALSTVMIACGSTFQALFVTSAVRRFFGVPIEIAGYRALLHLILLCGPIACLIAPTLGVLALVVTEIVPLPAVPENWITWWFGDMLGILIVVPIAVLSPWKKWSVSWKGSPLPAFTTTMIAGLFLLVGVTLVAWKIASVANYERNNDAFISLAGESEKALRHRLNSYRQSLDGGAALFAASDHVSVDDWKTYVDALDVRRTLPGINGIGYIAAIRGNNLDPFLKESAQDGLPAFEIHPRTQGPDHFIIKYIEPFALNKEAVGLDISFETHRYNAALHARDSGKATVTKRIFLVQDHTGQPGFLLLKPIYQTRYVPQTIERRREAISGWVYAPFIAGRFMEGLTASQGQSMNIRIVDGPSADGNVIFDSGTGAGAKPVYSLTKRLKFLEQEWTVTWSSTPAFERVNDTSESWTVLGGGLTITTVFGMLLLSLARREAYVRQEVDARTHELVEREHGLQTALSALKISESRFSALAGLSPAGIFRTDNFGFCNFANDAWLDASCLKANEAMGAGWIDAIHPDDRQRVHQAWLDSLGSEKSLRIEFRFREHEGTVTWIDLISGPEYDDRGSVIGFIGVAIDITDRKKLEAEMAKALERAEQATRAKSSFLANMSHEIRTPMNGVIGFAELLRESQLPAKQLRQVDLILDSSRSMMSLLNDILDFSKIEAGQMTIVPERVELRAKLTRWVGTLQPLAEKKKLAIEVDIAPDAPQWIDADPLRFRQILTNLLGNSIKFTDTGKVVLRAYMKSENLIAIEVEDTGIGIAQDRQGSIFEQFVQSDDSSARRYGGTGLGLAISFNLARLMGGSLSLRSTLGTGTVVTLELPVGQESRVPQKPGNYAASETASPARQQSLRILLAEDHDINQALLTDMLDQMGHRVDLACYGGEAVEKVLKARNSAESYNLVLMDIQMPEVDGRDATRQIRNAGIDAAELPIVALSANAYSEDVEECLAVGMQAHVAKPVRMRELKRAIETWAVQNETPQFTAEKTSPQSSGMEKLSERYLLRRKETISFVSELAQEQEVSDAAMDQLRKMLHKLAGSAGMFGDDELGRCAGAIEREIPIWQESRRSREVVDALARLNFAVASGEPAAAVDSGDS